MLKRITFALLLITMVAPISACRFIAPVAEDIGGGGVSGMSKTEMIMSQQGRNARKGEEFIDTYFLNYDKNDPYRGDYYVLDGSGR